MSQLVAPVTEFEIEPGGKMQDAAFAPDKACRVEAYPTGRAIGLEALKSAFIHCCISRGWITVDRETDSCCLTEQGKAELTRLGLRRLM
jgi:hypothetical protein